MSTMTATKNTCRQCGMDTLWTDRVCGPCKMAAGLTIEDLTRASMPAQAHTLRRVM
jgi:Ni,Fe-hydrogenase III large subunit